MKVYKKKNPLQSFLLIRTTFQVLYTLEYFGLEIILRASNMAPQNLPKSSCVGLADSYCKLVYLVRELTESCKEIWKYFSHLLIKRYYKSRQSYYKLRERFLQTTTKFSQIVTGVTNYDNIITNYDSYYKLRQTNRRSLGLVFNSIRLSRNFTTCRFLFVCLMLFFVFVFILVMYFLHRSNFSLDYLELYQINV